MHFFFPSNTLFSSVNLSRDILGPSWRVASRFTLTSTNFSFRSWTWPSVIHYILPVSIHSGAPSTFVKPHQLLKKEEKTCWGWEWKWRRKMAAGSLHKENNRRSIIRLKTSIRCQPMMTNISFCVTYFLFSPFGFFYNDRLLFNLRGWNRLGYSILSQY
jgi:hypothetical protein